MKKLALSLLAIASLASCTERYNPSYEQRCKGVHDALPNGIYIHSEQMDFAIDTTTNPNKIYKVKFCDGFIFPAYQVDHLIKIN